VPSRETVERFIAMVESNDHVRAIEEFYAEDASMQENLSAPRIGRDVLVAHEKAALARVASVHTHEVTTFLVDGDHVAIHWTFDFTLPDGSSRRFDEVALQVWRGEKIAVERFFYDPATVAPKPPAS
jgi:ketosteroid isomerase-like protein